MYTRSTSSDISQNFGESPAEEICDDLYEGDEDEIQQNIRSQLSQACSCRNTGHCVDAIKDDTRLPFPCHPVVEAGERHEIFLYGKRLITQSKAPPPPFLANNVLDDVPKKTYTHGFPELLRFFKSIVHEEMFESYQYEGSFLEVCLKEERIDAVYALYWAGYFAAMSTWTRNTASSDTILKVIAEQSDSICKTVVKDLFKEEASLNMLQQKARQGHIKAVHMLVERHPFMLETPSYKGFTSVYYAVASGLTEILTCLEDAGVSLTPHSYDVESVLQFSVQCGCPDVVRHIVQKHNLHSELTPATLEKALSQVDGSTVRTLLELRPSLGTALMPRLVQCREAAMFDTVVDSCEINVNTTDDAGRTGMLLACQNGDTDIINKLLSLGADISVKDHQNRSVLFYSILSGECKVLQLMLSELKSRGFGSLINAADRYLGRERLYLVTGLDSGIRGYHYILVHRYLLHYFRERIKDGGSFDVSTCGDVIKSGWNNPTDEVKQEVLARYHPANVSNQSKLDMSPLHFAILCQQRDMAAILIEQGADVRATDSFRLTPAHYAAMLGFYPLLQKLVAVDPAAAKDLDNNFKGIEEIARANLHSIEQLHIAVPQLITCQKCTGQLCILVDVTKRLHETISGENSSPSLPSLKEAILKHTMQQKVKTYTNPLGKLCCMIRQQLPATVAPQAVLDEKGFTLLHVAVLEGRVDAVEALVHTGWFCRMFPARVNNPRSQYHDMNTLDIARKCRMDKMQKFLAQSQATEESMSALHKLARIGDIKEVKKVISKHPDLLQVTTSDSSTVMKWAIVSGNVDLVKLLEKEDATLDKIADGETAVGVAVAMRNPTMVKYVVSKMKSTINKASKQILPLMAAMQNDDWESFQTLVTEGAELHPRVVVVLAGKSDLATWQMVEPRVDINCKDTSTGKTPLYSAVEGANTEIVKHLLKNQQCKIEIKDLRHRNLLFAAITSGDFDVFKLVVGALKKRKLQVKVMANEKDQYLGSERSFQVSGRDGGRIGYHHVEVHRVYLHIFRKLTTSGGACDVAKYGEILTSGWGTMSEETRRQIDARYKATNVSDQLDMTPLHYSLIREQEKMALELIKQGADINTQDRFGARPSHYAAMRGYNDVLYELEKRGDTFNFSDDLQNTPIDVAQANQQTKSLNFFHGKKYITNPRHRKFKEDMNTVLSKIEEDELHKVRRLGRSPQSHIVYNLREGSALINSYLYDLGTTSVAQASS